MDTDTLMVRYVLWLIFDHSNCYCAYFLILLTTVMGIIIAFNILKYEFKYFTI